MLLLLLMVIHEGVVLGRSFPFYVQLLLRVGDHLDLVVRRWLLPQMTSAGKQRRVRVLVDDRVLLLLLLLLLLSTTFLLDPDLLLHGRQHLLLGEMLLLLLLL